jgi:hypothetical protein
MRSNVWIVGLLFGATAWVPGASLASTHEAVKADTKGDFAVVVAAVKSEMPPGGRYEFVNSSERSTIDSNFAEMQSLFEQFGSVSNMDKDAKFKLYVDQENVDAILTHRDDRRMVCVSERPIGSLIPKRVCRTYGAVEHDRQNAHDEMIRSARPGYTSYDGGLPPGVLKPGSVH